VSRKTTTTTVVHSRKDASGDWRETEKTVTTVVERDDDDGYPYTVPRFTPKPFFGGYGWMDGFHVRPVNKREDENNG
jgi:hypothetical protein